MQQKKQNNISKMDYLLESFGAVNRMGVQLGGATFHYLKPILINTKYCLVRDLTRDMWWRYKMVGWTKLNVSCVSYTSPPSY